MNDLEVRCERLFQDGFAEHGAIRDLAGEERDNDEEFVNLTVSVRSLSEPCVTYSLNETGRDLILRCSPNRSLEVVLRLGIVQLNRSQSSSVEQPSNRLGLVDLPLEVGFGDQTVGLVVLVVGKVRAKKEVDHSHFGRFVFAQSRGLARGKKETGINTVSRFGIWAVWRLKRTIGVRQVVLAARML